VTERQPHRLSVVLLGSDLDRSLAALTGDVEVVVVQPDSGDAPPAVTDTVRRVTVAEDLPCGAAANRGVAATTGAVVVVLAGPARPMADDLAALADMLAGPNAPRALLPCVVTGSGGLLEAGAAVTGDGRLVPISPAPGDADFARDAEATSYGSIAMRRSTFQLVGGFHPLAPDPESAVVEFVVGLQQRHLPVRVHPGFRLVAEEEPTGRARVDIGWLRELWPDYVAGLPAAVPTVSAHAAVAARDARAGERILLIHSRVPSPGIGLGEHRVAQLLTALVDLWPTARVTLAAMDGAPAAGEGAALRYQGVEVVTGPRDWAGWLQHRLGHYTHVILTGTGLEHRFASLLAATQPQAARILATEGLDFRGPASQLSALAEQRAEMPGLRHLTAALRQRVENTVGRTDVVWCADEVDRTFLRGLLPGLPCQLIPDGPPAAAALPGPSDRRDVLVLAGPGADAFAGHEEAAVVAVRDVLPQLRAHDSGLVLRVLTERPSPMLLRLADHPGVSLESPIGDPVQRFRAARLVLAPYLHGLGGRLPIALAIAGGTPFVTTTAGAAGSDLGAMSGRVVAGDLATFTQRARELLTDAPAWAEIQAQVLELAARRGARAFGDALVAAAAELGIAPPPGRRVAVLSAAPFGSPPAPPPPLLAPIPPRFRQPRRIAPVRREPADEQYRQWLDRFGPTPERLDAIGAAVGTVDYRPLISVVMPTYDTEPDLLDVAISSVVDQVYERWELCVADDCSTRPQTRAVLDRRAAADDRIRVTYLEANAGIAAATNAALARATGEFVAFLDHDDELKPHALAEVVMLLAGDPTLDVVYTDEDKRDESGRLVEPFFKPDWSPDHLMSRNYMSHLTVIRRGLVEQVGGLRQGYDGSQDHDLLLRVTEITERVGHVPQPLYTWRRAAGSTAAVVDAKPYAFDAAKRALEDALERRCTPGRVEDGLLPSTYRVRYDVVGDPSVSIIIPTRDRLELLRRCIDSIREKSTYSNYEILVVDNESSQPETLEWLATFGGTVLRYPYHFNYARMMNLAGWSAEGDLLLFLNNDTSVITPDWIESLVEHAQRSEVGAVGCRLLYPNGRVQHEGIVVNYAGGHAGNVDHKGWWGFGEVVRDCTAVTGAVTMMRPSVFAEVGGFEERFRVAWNDVDLCLRIRQAGYRVVYTPYALLHHHESASRGFVPHPEDDELFDEKWAPREYRDPYYNVNLDRSYPFRIYS